METQAIGVSLGFSTAVSIIVGLAPLVATWLISGPETELLSDLHRAAQPLRVDGDPVAQPARHSSTCAPGAACRALRRHPGAGRCKPAAVRPKSLLWIDVPLRSRSREWLLLPHTCRSQSASGSTQLGGLLPVCFQVDMRKKPTSVVRLGLAERETAALEHADTNAAAPC